MKTRICIYYSEKNKCISSILLPSSLKLSKNTDLLVLKIEKDKPIAIQAFDKNNQCLATAELINAIWRNKFLTVDNNVNNVGGVCSAFFSEQAKNISFKLVDSKDFKSSSTSQKEDKSAKTDSNDFIRRTTSFFTPWQNNSSTQNTSTDDDGAKTPVINTFEELGESPALTRSSNTA